MCTWGRIWIRNSDYITPDPQVQISLYINQYLPSKKNVRAKNILSAEYLLSRSSECLTGFLLLKSIFSLPPTSLHCPRVTSRVETNAMFIWHY